LIGGSLARRYARALLDIGREEKALRRILEEGEAFAALLASSPELREALEAEHVNRRDKQGAVEAAAGKLGLLGSTKNFLLLLAEKGRFAELPAILAELKRMVEEAEGVERVEVSAPSALDGAQREALRAALAERTGKKIELEERVDPSLLGGMVVKVGSTVYDGSVRTQIQKIRENLKKG
jgi:F-type H+-transporting ATPase subunit delta